MIPTDINNSAKYVIEAINAYEQDTKADASSLSAKVSEFVKNNANTIKEGEKKKISDLLGRLSNTANKNKICSELTELISSIAKTAQPLSVKQSNVTISKKIASLLASNDPNVLCMRIKDYPHLTLEERFELLKAISLTSVIQLDVLAQNIHSFGIPNDQMDYFVEHFITKDLILILCHYLKNFKLSENQSFALASRLIELGKGNLVAEYYKNFQLNEAHKQMIVEKLLQKDPWNLFNNIDQFNLSPADNLKFAWIAVRLHPRNFSISIKKYNLNPVDRLAIARYSVSRDNMGMMISLYNYELDDRSNTEIIFRALRKTPDEADILFGCLSLDDIPTKIPADFDGLDKQITVAPNDTKLWWKSFQMVINDCPPKQYKQCAALAQLIYNLENPAARYILSAVLFEYKVPPDLKDAPEHKQLLNILIAPLAKEAHLTEAETAALWTILGSKDYREAAKKEKAIKGLYALLDSKELTGEDKKALLKHIIDKNKDQPAYNALQMLDAIISSNNVALLKEHGAKEADEKGLKAEANTPSGKLKPIDLMSTVQQIFKSLIGMEKITDFGKKYEMTIAKSRNPGALLIYAANLETLSDEERQPALKALKEFTESVFNGTYDKMRYEASSNSHLAVVFKKNSKLQEKWQKGHTLTVGEIYKKSTEEGLKMAAVEKQVETPQETMMKFLREKVLRDKHLNPVIYKHFATCLEDPKKCDVALKLCKGDITAATKLLGEQDFKSLTPDINNKITLPYFQSKLEEALISLLKAPQSQRTSLIAKLIISVRSLYGHQAQFAADLEILKRQLEEAESKSKEDSSGIEKSEANYDNYVVADTGTWEDMILSGTEVSGSCQRISGDVHFNKCLLAYMLDGKNRAIVIKNPKTGKIVARSLMRLLWDEKDGKAVLFQERLYVNPGVPNRAKTAIDLMFAMRAKELQVPLVKSVPDIPDKWLAMAKIPRYLHDLMSLGSPAPFEYVDAAGKGITDGKFTLPSNSIQLVQP